MGRHAGSRTALPSRRGRHASRTTPGPRSGGLVAALVLGATAAAVALPAATTPAADAAAPAAAAPVVAPAPQRVDLMARAARDRPVPVATPTPTPTPTSTPTPPPPPALPGCSEGAVARALAVDTGGYENGRLPDDVLCTAVGSADERLRADAALALVPLAAAYAARFGESICTTDGYRPLAEQRVLRQTRPRYAAPVGTSEHGWGTAIDVSCGVNSFGTERHAWMRENAPRFGWDLPVWARADGSRPEPWHWEYVR